MPLITISALATIGLSLITGTIKCLKEDTLSKAAIEGFDGLFGGVLGNVCHEKFNEYKKRLEKLNVPEQNADVERCSRHALLQALIIFGEAAKEHLPTTGLTSKQQDECLYFLSKSQEHLKDKLKDLLKLNDTNAILQRNPLTQDNRLALAIAEKSEPERLEAVKTSLALLPLHEFGYIEGNLLHEQLKVWLSEGLPNSRHWFVYYIHELHANLKKDEPSYCRNARNILIQKQLADISLMSRKVLNQLNDLMPLTSEIKNLLGKYEQYLISIKEDTSRIPVIENDVKAIRKQLEAQNIRQKLSTSITNLDKQGLRDDYNAFFPASTIKEKELIAELEKHHKLCLTGLPGVGKSFIAKKIAYENKNKYDVVWWIDADNEKVESELIELAREVFITKEFTKEAFDKWLDKNDPDYIEEKGVIKKLQAKLDEYSWLIVFDNAMDITPSKRAKNNEIKQKSNNKTEEEKAVLALEKYRSAYLPRINNSDQLLLLTSRNKVWSKIQDSIPVKTIATWKKEDIKDFLVRPEPYDEGTIEVNNIDQLTIFGGLPLAAAIAKSYILDSDEEGKYDFANFHNKWSKKLAEVRSKRHKKRHEKLLTTIALSYDALEEGKKIFNLLSCFAPDELPIKALVIDQPKLIEQKFQTDWDGFRKHLIQLDKLSLCTFDQKTNLYSMHRLVQECVRALQKDALNYNYIFALSLLADAFQDKQNKELLLSHIDVLADIVRHETLNLTAKINDEESLKAVQLFIDAGQYHAEVGDNKSASEQFTTAITITEVQAKHQENQKKLKNLEANAQKRLANALFLRGKDFFDAAQSKATDAATYFASQGNRAGYIECINDVRVKIYQRKCEFNAAKVDLLEIKKEVEQYHQSIGTEEQVLARIVYECITERKKDLDESEKKKYGIAEKISGINHNLGSLYWTWGGPGHYQEADKYFQESINFQDRLVKALEGAYKQADNTQAEQDLEKKIKNKKLWLNVSRMIYGSVLGLLKNFDGQFTEHTDALSYFEENKEKRRYAYTAYYQLAHSWDREALEEEWSIGLKADELIDKIKKYDETLTGNDEKYDLINKIINLREAVRKSKKHNWAGGYYNALKVQLEDMKYKFKQDEQWVFRYYDVDTFSVSAILEYADFLSKNKKVDDAVKVAEFGLTVIKDIEYPRREELEVLVTKQ